jgi:mono/diheme cytochrome c family protein/rhodanese-related sulfurtransferase
MRGLLAVWLVAACSYGAATPTPASQGSQKPRDAHPADADLTKLDGAALYQALCTPCHGADAKGYKADHAPSLVNSTFLESATDDFIARSIMNGRPGTSMAAYGRGSGGPLGDMQVAAIVAWVRAQGPQPKALPASGTGDPKRGQPIYERDCQKCHGTQTTRGEGVHLANPRFLDSATDSFMRWAIVHGRPGTPMEAWQSKLSDQDIDDVVAYVRTFGKANQAEGQLAAPTGKEPLVIHPGGKDPVFTLTTDPGAQDKRYVSAEQVMKALEQKKKMIIIDARPPSEWMRVHITGAVSIPYHDLKRLDDMPKDGTWAIAYCACPHHLSGVVVDELRKRGYAHSAVLDEGILEWHRRGYPVVAAPGVQPPPKEQPLKR